MVRPILAECQVRRCIIVSEEIFQIRRHSSADQYVYINKQTAEGIMGVPEV